MNNNNNDGTLVAEQLLQRVMELELENAKLKVIKDKYEKRIKMLTAVNQQLESETRGDEDGTD